jgi:hypothetical protein
VIEEPHRRGLGSLKLSSHEMRDFKTGDGNEAKICLSGEVKLMPIRETLTYEGSQKIRFSILLPPNNFTQRDASLFTYYSLHFTYFST